MQLLSPASRDGIKFRFSVVVRRAPGARDPAFLHQPHQRRINRALIDLQRLFADLFDAPRDSVTVQRPHGFQRLQHHQIQCALQDFRFFLAHAPSCGVPTGVSTNSCGMSTRKTLAPASAELTGHLVLGKCESVFALSRLTANLASAGPYNVRALCRANSPPMNTSITSPPFWTTCSASPAPAFVLGSTPSLAGYRASATPPRASLPSSSFLPPGGAACNPSLSSA